jgi:hypothetical protein
MKRYLIAAAVAALIGGTGAASAQYSSTDTHVKTKTDAQTSTRQHKRHHRATSGRGIETRDNNASASGSILPGKDRLNSKAYIADH